MPALVLPLAATGGPAPQTIAIVVNKGNGVETLSGKDLKAIFSGEKQRWPDGQKVQTLAIGTDAPGHKGAIRFLFGMTEEEYQKFVLHAGFTGNAQLVPKDFGTSQAVLKFVTLIPGAIAFVNADAVSPAVRVVKVDGLAPGDAGYPMNGPK